MDIIGFENYLIYRDGRVYSKKGKGKFLKQSDNGEGYMRVDLCKNCKGINRRVHRLIAIHYIPNPDNKKYVDHIDRNRSNNDISNLRWVTSCENNQNRGTPITNTSGHKYIHKTKYGWSYGKSINNKRHFKRLKSLTDALCYKFIMILKFKAQIVTPILPLK